MGESTLDAFGSMGPYPSTHRAPLTAPWGGKLIEWHEISRSSAARHEVGRRYNTMLVGWDPLARLDLGVRLRTEGLSQARIY